MATTTDPGLKALYARLYGRNDLRGSALRLAAARGGGQPCGCCVACSISACSRVSGTRPRDRALLAFGYGPALVPLGLLQPRSTIAVAGKRIPVRAGAQLLGGSVLMLCVLPFFLGGEQSSHRARWQRLARQHAGGKGGCRCARSASGCGSTARACRWHSSRARSSASPSARIGAMSR